MIPGIMNCSRLTLQALYQNNQEDFKKDSFEQTTNWRFFNCCCKRILLFIKQNTEKKL